MKEQLHADSHFDDSTFGVWSKFCNLHEQLLRISGYWPKDGQPKQSQHGPAHVLLVELQR